MAAKFYIVLSVVVALSVAQRSPYAGRRPIGYPELQTITTTTTTTADELGNRFGDGQTTQRTTTIRLPIEALGDRDLVERLSKMPIDQQPFWLINWQQLEAHRKKPQTYQQRPNSFIGFPNTDVNIQPDLIF